MTTTDTPNVTVQLANLRAKVTFLEDQLAERTTERDENRRGWQVAESQITDLVAAGTDLRAKITFARDQLTVRTSQRDEALARREAELRTYVEGNVRAGQTIERLCSDLDSLRPHLAVLVDRQAQWGDTEAAVTFVSNWLEGYKP